MQNAFQKLIEWVKVKVQNTNMRLRHPVVAGERKAKHANAEKPLKGFLKMLKT